MKHHLLRAVLLAAIFVLALIPGRSGAESAASFGGRLYDTVRSAEVEVIDAGQQAAVERAKVFSQNVCDGLVAEIDTADGLALFQNEYDDFLRKRGKIVAQVQEVLKQIPADEEGREYVEEGVRRALVLEDARPAVMACLDRRRTQLGL